MGLRLQLRKQQAEAGDIVLLYGDESEALTHPYLARAWAKSGADLRVPAPGQAKKVAMLGSLDHVTRQLIVHTSPTKRSSDFIAHLEQLDRFYAPQPGRQAKPVVLVEDNGPIHTSKRSLAAMAVRAHWLTVEWLPKYAPELNDIEPVWRDLKAHHLAHQTFTDAAALDQAIHDAVSDLNRERIPDLLAKPLFCLVVWIHGCIGLHFWLKLKPGYTKVKNLLLSFAVLLPPLTLLGYYQGGRLILRLAESSSWRAENSTPGRIGTPDENALLIHIRNDTLVTLAALLAAAFLARGLRRLGEHWVGSIVLTYPDRAVRVRRGLSVLEASLINGIPHAHVCGGRGRCSTCRIRILGDLSALPPMSAAEKAVLDRIHAGVGVRLACQLRPTQNLAFAPLLPPHATVADVRRRGPTRSGEERYVVIMFVDMRGSSRLAEKRLPYDTVFIINQFLNAVSDAVSDAVIAAGGEPNTVLGDGLLALFGLTVGQKHACRQAVAACAGIAANVESLNRALAYGPVEPIRFGIGLHARMTVAGEIGYERHAQFTVIGDPVNVAARLQDLTKAFGCEMLMSEEVYVQAGLEGDDLPAHEVDARGREARVRARSVARAADLAALIEAQAPAASGGQVAGECQGARNRQAAMITFSAWVSAARRKYHRHPGSCPA